MEADKTLHMARRMKGYLFKKSSQILLGWQKRFWLISGNQLIYYADQALGQQKGTFELSLLSDVQPHSNKEFSFNYRERHYELKAEESSIRDEWVKSLRALSKSLGGGQKSPPKLINPSSEQSKRNSMEDYRRSSSKLEKVKLTKPIDPDRDLSEQSFLHAVGLSKVADLYDNPRISSRVLFGYFKQGYYFMISCKSLSLNYQDQEILSEEYAKPYELNVLYKAKQGDSYVKEVAKGSAVTDVKLRSQKELAVSCGFALILTSIYDITRFNQRLQRSVLISREYHNDKGIVLRKNIDLYVKGYDQYKSLIERRQKVKITFEAFLNKLKTKHSLKPVNSFQSLQAYIKVLTEDLKEFADACMVKPVARVDLMQEYASFIHSKIYALLHQFWDSAHYKMPPDDILELAKICVDYYQTITKYVKDQRLVSGPGILCSIYFRTVINELEGEMDAIQQKLIHATLEVREDILVNRFVSEYSSMIGAQVKKVLSYAATQAAVSQCCQFIYESLKIWLGRMTKIVQSTVDINLLISFCNDYQSYKNVVFGVFQNLVLAKGTTQQVYLKAVSDSKANQLLINYHEDCVKGLFMVLFSGISPKILTTRFMELDIDALCKEVLNRLDSLHNFREDVYHQVQKKALQEVIEYYASTLAKTQRVSTDTLIKKINSDRNKIQEIFRSVVKQPELGRYLQQLTIVVQFMIADSPITIRKHCLALVALPKNTFNIKFAKSLLQLKNGLSRDQMAELQRICQDIFSKAEQQQEEQKDLFEPVSKESYLENWAASSRRRSTITMSLADKQAIQLTQIDRKVTVTYQMEGYLQKKKLAGGKSQVFYEQRYCRLNDQNLLWFLTKESVEPQNCIKLTEVIKVERHYSKDNVFFVEVPQAKYKFMAESARECKSWIDAIKKFVDSKNKIEAKTYVITQKNDLFVDYFADNTKPSYKQSPSNQTGRRQSVLSVLSNGNSPVKKATIRDSEIKKDRKTPQKEPRPQKRQPMQRITDAEVPKGCWCIKFN